MERPADEDKISSGRWQGIKQPVFVKFNGYGGEGGIVPPFV